MCQARGGKEREIKYQVKGSKGKQCRDCRFFEAASGNPSQGKCFGKDVIAQGTCNMFASR